jgi:hypothetical protein
MAVWPKPFDAIAFCAGSMFRSTSSPEWSACRSRQGRSGAGAGLVEMMSNKSRLRAGSVAFQHWHVIEEIDLMRLIADHRDLERLCVALEGYADDLPHQFPEFADNLCRTIEISIVAHIEREDARLNAFFGRDPPTPLARGLLARIRAGHNACAIQAQDLVAALRPDRADGHTLNSDTLAYMLCGFFDYCRQAMAFEELAILQLGGGRLTTEARAMLCNSIAMRCRHQATAVGGAPLSRS